MIAPFDLVELDGRTRAPRLELVPADLAGILLSDTRRPADPRQLDPGHAPPRAARAAARGGTLLRVVPARHPRPGRDLLGATTRWPTFALAAPPTGVTAVYAIPMTLREHRLGALTLSAPRTHPRRRASADRAGALEHGFFTIAVLNQRSFREQEILTQQLQAALSRVLIEQAKGILAERERREMDRPSTSHAPHGRSADSCPTSPPTWSAGSGASATPRRPASAWSAGLVTTVTPRRTPGLPAPERALGARRGPPVRRRRYGLRGLAKC